MSAIADPTVLGGLLDDCFGTGGARAFAGALTGMPIPAPEAATGLLVLCTQAQPGNSTSYLMGRLSQSGFPGFFPAALLFKTPLPLLLLALAGIALALSRGRRAGWQHVAPAGVIAAILLVLVPSKVNVGVRHVLPLYGLLALAAGGAVVGAFRATSRRLAARASAALAAGLALAAPVRAWPDHLATFSILAGPDPARVLLDSDLDWGQDLLRLERALAQRNVPQLSIAYFGVADLCRHALPPLRWLRPHERAQGWIAISEMYRRGVVGFQYRNGDPCDESQRSRAAVPDPTQYAWLEEHRPVMRVGRSILVYYVPR